MLDLRPDLHRHFPGDEPVVFDRIMNLEGQIFRSLAGRKTLRFALDGKGYFAKLHYGVGWREILKNLLMARRPVLGAREEWCAIHRLEELGIATMSVAGFGERGCLPSRRQSFLITDELANTTSLEDYCREWPVEAPPASLKRALIEKVANIAKHLHNNGVNHRDFYICHFLLDRDSVAEGPFRADDLRLYVIDLHRVQIRHNTPRRWIVKDVAALGFSSMEIGLTRRDRFRFMEIYSGKPWRVTLGEDHGFWGSVAKKAEQLYRKRPQA